MPRRLAMTTLEAENNLEIFFQQALRSLIPHEPAHIAIACSGGADSMALALLAKKWASKHPASLTALIVDHGLRHTSAAEAMQTVRSLSATGIASHILTLNLAKGNGIQERARDARYAALVNWCNTHNASHLLLGHHAGDQAETILFRLLRGSGLAGLAGMASRREMNGITLLRPLLSVNKSDLEQYLRAQDMDWFNDPSNSNRDFMRTRLRQLLASNASLNPVKRLNRVAQSLGHYRHKEESRILTLVDRYLQPFLIASIWVNADIQYLAPQDRIELFSRALTAIDGGRELPRHADMERLMNAINDRRPYTLHRCLILPYEHETSHGWLICREPAAVEAPSMLNAHTTLRWDRRFVVEPTSMENLTIGALGEVGWRSIRDHIATPIPRHLVYGLPALRRLDSVLSVPHIGYVADGNGKNLPAIDYQPAKPLAEAPFCAMIHNDNDL